MKYSSVFLAVALSVAVVGPCSSAPAEAAEETVLGVQKTSDRGFFHTLLRSKRQQDQQPKCQEIGQYCRYHEECCSKLCLSFSYKCVTRPPQSQFQPVIQNGASAGTQTNFPVEQVAPAAEVDNRFGGNSGSTVAQCTAAGGYCQRSSECCSRTCLSFSYKCSSDPKTPALNRPPSGTVQSSQSGQSGNSNVFEVGQFLPRPEGEISLEELVNRFGGGGGGVENNVVTANRISETLESSTGKPSRPASSLLPPPATGRPGDTSTSSGSQCVSNGGQCDASNQCCSRLCVRLGPVTQFCAEQVQAETTRPSSTVPVSQTETTSSCLPVGGKCYTSGECCSGRCHIYMHQCVT